MFHRATNVEFKTGTVLEVSFQTGEVKEYDMAQLFSKYPQLKELKKRSLFCSGKLAGSYGIIWNEELDIETETIYQDGKTVRIEKPTPIMALANELTQARIQAGISQAELGSRTGIDQSDISKIERGASNPSIATLTRLAEALGCTLSITLNNK